MSARTSPARGGRHERPPPRRDLGWVALLGLTIAGIFAALLLGRGDGGETPAPATAETAIFGTMGWIATNFGWYYVLTVTVVVVFVPLVFVIVVNVVVYVVEMRVLVTVGVVLSVIVIVDVVGDDVSVRVVVVVLVSS